MAASAFPSRLQGQLDERPNSKYANHECFPSMSYTFQCANSAKAKYPACVETVPINPPDSVGVVVVHVQ